MLFDRKTKPSDEFHPIGEKPHYTMAMVVTCEKTPYQIREGDIIEHRATGQWYMVSSIFIPGDEPIIGLIPYEPIYVNPNSRGKLVGYDHIFISQSSAYPIYAIDNDISELEVCVPETSD